MAVELANRQAQRRLSARVDRTGVALTLAFVASSLLATLVSALWALEGVAPKVVAFASLSTALLHTSMVRATWISFGIATAIPLVAGVFFTVSHLFQHSELSDALAASALLITMLVFVARSMLAMHLAQ